MGWILEDPTLDFKLVRKLIFYETHVIERVLMNFLLPRDVS